MRVFIISAVFPPETLMSAFTSADLAEELTRRGHEVVVFAPFPNRPSGRLYNGYSRRWWQVEQRSGYRIVHSWHTLSGASSLLSRSLENLSFAISSTLALEVMKRPAVVYMNTWPILSQGLNSLVLRCKRVPIVCAIQDVYPESLMGKGMLAKGGWLSRAIQFADRRFLTRCAKVTTLSEGMREHIIAERLLPAEKVVTIQNWLDASPFRADLPKQGPFRGRHGIGPEKFVAMFAGSLTGSAGMDLYVDAAEQLRPRDDILIVLAGDGSMRAQIESEIAARKLDNIRVVRPLLPEEVPEVQAAADVMLLSLGGQTTQNAAPSKLVAYMFSGRPTLASVSEGSPPACVLRDAGAGVVVPPNDPRALARRLAEWADDRSQLEQMGENARHYARQNLARDVQLARLANVVEETANTAS